MNKIATFAIHEINDKRDGAKAIPGLPLLFKGVVSRTCAETVGGRGILVSEPGRLEGRRRMHVLQ